MANRQVRLHILFPNAAPSLRSGLDEVIDVMKPYVEEPTLWSNGVAERIKTGGYWDFCLLVIYLTLVDLTCEHLYDLMPDQVYHLLERCHQNLLLHFNATIIRCSRLTCVLSVQRSYPSIHWRRGVK